ncbi:MAG: hypothetical protein KTR31_22115 [Myxococcales bacterium]|nr:hypothetical protein [Myxococcales bacterium]
MHRTVPLTLALVAAAPASAALAPAPEPPPPLQEAPAEPPEAEPIDTVQEPTTEFASDTIVTVREPRLDLFALAQTIELLAPISDNAFLLGQSAFVGAPVDGDVMALGEVVEIGSEVAGDVYAMGRLIQINEEGSVGGNVFTAGADVEVLGPVAGNLTGGAGSIEIAAPIGGDVHVEVGELRLSQGAAIHGDLTYEAASEAPRAIDVTTGDVIFTQSADHDVHIVVDPIDDPVIHVDLDDILDEEEEQQAGILTRAAEWTFWRGWAFITKLIVGAAILVLGGATAGRVSGVLREQPGPSLGVGVIVAVALPALSLFSVVTIVGSPLGVLGFMSWLALMYVAQLFAAQAIGDLVLEQVRPGAVGSPYVSMAVGLVPLVVLSSVPWFGWLLWFAAVLVGIGAMWLTYRPGSPEQTTV